MRIKVCGLTRASDALHALNVGATDLGFVHHPPSPRHLEAGDLSSLIRSLPDPSRAVLVVVDRGRAEVEALLEATGAGAVQLCGQERPEEFLGLEARILRRLGVGDGAHEEMAAWRALTELFVLDDPASAGGSGRHVDRALARELAAAAPSLLAGGLGPTSVEAGIRAVRPAGVDASSGLESAPGQKDPQEVESFVRLAQGTTWTEVSGD